MTINPPDIRTLPITAADISDTAGCTKNLQQLTSAPTSRDEAEHVLQHIAAVIEREVGETASAGGDSPTAAGAGAPVAVAAVAAAAANQVVLNLTFRAYFELLHRHELDDARFGHVYAGPQRDFNEASYQMLYAILLTGQWKRIDAVRLKERLVQSLQDAIEHNGGTLLAILKALNLLCKKYPELDVALSLDHVYSCLQSNNGQVGVREETLVLFTHSCASERRAFRYFQVICTLWPWTNRNKYYLLSSILQQHSLRDFLNASGQSACDFFAGIRLSLHYKSLLAASQYLIKALSGDESGELLQLAAEILTRGSLHELQNLYSQWFGRLSRKDVLFQLLQQRPEIASFLEDSRTNLLPDNVDNYRLVLIFGMFSRQIYAVSKLHFFKISTELITNCFQCGAEAQLLIYRFVVDNLSVFAIEDCLEFVLAFVQHHKAMESAQFRNGILGKMPTIVNYVAKTFAKLNAAAESTTLGASIKTFFQQMQLTIDADIGSTLYQPKIFALRLLEILLRSLYVRNPQKNAKNCIVTQNRQLGLYLIEQGIYDASKMSARLLELLDDPLGFDDALELIVALLQQMEGVEAVAAANALQSSQLCRQHCERCDIDECVLSALYAKVALQSYSAADERSRVSAQLYAFAQSALEEATVLDAFRADPLVQCKTGHHLFGYLSVLNEIVLGVPSVANLPGLVLLLERVLSSVLEMLNFGNKDDKSAMAAASFQDMDESLELLVQASGFDATAGSHDELRKFLLMSFWLTLKACCDLATSIGCLLAPSSESSAVDLELLERCLKANVAVLTRCRHKGAIESAGVSIGKLTKSITAQLPTNAKAYALLHHCLQLLFDDDKHVSTTRRGAGFSIMFLHIVKNEEQRSRPILKRAVGNILERLRAPSTSKETAPANANCDRIEALTLHYLGVLVKDTELRDATVKYYSEIMLAAMLQIDNTDWTICNAALQLFGALIPKIVGQRQATEFEAPIPFDCTELTFSEVTRKLPVACEQIVQYCSANFGTSTATRSIILFLGFFAKVEHLRKDEAAPPAFLVRFRELMWRLLRHNSEKVRQLAALCFVRAHDFRCDLPPLLLQIASIVFEVRNENFFEGLVYTLHEGVLKILHESKHTLEAAALERYMADLRDQLVRHFKANCFKLYTLSKLLELFKLLGVEGHSASPAFATMVREFVAAKACVGSNGIGYDVWHDKVKECYN